jgi:2,6-dihydroxypyridine 3-monooxygenase
MSGAEGPLRIAVAGGSIGGLCPGLALRGRAGFDVQVYERISGPMETRGAGIVVQGELIDLLRTHGANTLPTTRCRVRRYLSAEGADGRVQRAPQEFTSWEAIYRTLVDAFPSERYHRGCNAHGLRQRQGRGEDAPCTRRLGRVRLPLLK